MNNWHDRLNETLGAVLGPAAAVHALAGALPADLRLDALVNAYTDLNIRDTTYNPVDSWARDLSHSHPQAHSLGPALATLAHRLRGAIEKRLIEGQRDGRLLVAADFAGGGVKMLWDSDQGDGLPLDLLDLAGRPGSRPPRVLAVGRRDKAPTALREALDAAGPDSPQGWWHADREGPVVLLGPGVPSPAGGWGARPWYFLRDALALTRTRRQAQLHEERQAAERQRQAEEEARQRHTNPAAVAARLREELYQARQALAERGG